MIIELHDKRQRNPHRQHNFTADVCWDHDHTRTSCACRCETIPQLQYNTGSDIIAPKNANERAKLLLEVYGRTWCSFSLAVLWFGRTYLKTSRETVFLV